MEPSAPDGSHEDAVSVCERKSLLRSRAMNLLRNAAQGGLRLSWSERLPATSLEEPNVDGLGAVGALDQFEANSLTLMETLKAACSDCG